MIKMTYIKYIIFTLSLFLLLITPSQQGNDSASTKVATQKVIGFSQSGNESSWKKANAQSIIDELSKENYNVLKANAFLNTQKQIEDLRRFIAYKVDAIVLSPVTDKGLEDVLQEAKIAKIPVILVNQTTQSKLSNPFLTHIGPSYKSEGNRAGLYVLNSFLNTKKETVRIAEIAGNDTSLMSDQRSSGFSEIIKRHPAIQVVSRYDGNYIQFKTESLIRQAVKNNEFDAIDVLYVHSDEMLYGALNAIQSERPELLKQLKIVTIEGSNKTISLLKQGLIHCVVESNPIFGWNVANTVTRYFNTFHSPNEIYISGTVFSDQGNLAVIPPRNY